MGNELWVKTIMQFWISCSNASRLLSKPRRADATCGHRAAQTKQDIGKTGTWGHMGDRRHCRRRAQTVMLSKCDMPEQMLTIQLSHCRRTLALWSQTESWLNQFIYMCDRTPRICTSITETWIMIKLITDRFSFFTDCYPGEKPWCKQWWIMSY